MTVSVDDIGGIVRDSLSMVAADALNQVIAETALIRGDATRTRRQRRARGTAKCTLNQVEAPVSPGLVAVPIIVAIGPFDDPVEARLLATAFIAVRQQCEAQLVLLGSGAYCTAVTQHTAAQGVGDRVQVVRDSCDDRWSDIVAAADLVALNSSSGTATLLDVLAAGRPVVAPADPAIVPLVVPGIAGLVYPPGDASGMAAALLRLLTAPTLRRGMGGRAMNVARRHRIELSIRHRSHDGNRT
jgi:glycosyltransferase involved in cell wall biosynthesis